MLRRVLFLSLMLLATAGANAQSGHPPHVRPPHPPGHMPPDPATRALLHALFHGNWQGAFAPGQHASGALELSVAADSAHGLVVQMMAAQAARSGRGADFKVEGGRFSWTQDLAGNTCKATATVTSATKTEPQTMKGTMTCGDQASAFILRKTVE
jgi:hypothetical protein